MNDTSTEVAEMVRRRYLAMTPAERMAIASSMFETARTMAMASFPPGLSPQEVRRRLCERFYGELAGEAFKTK